MRNINVAIIVDKLDIKTKKTLMRKLNRFLDHIPGDLHASCACQITSDYYIKNEMEKTQYTEIEAGPRTMLNVLWNDLEYIDNNIDVVILGPTYSDSNLQLYMSTLPYAIPTILWPFHSIVEGSDIKTEIRSFVIGIVSRNKIHYLLENQKLPKFSDDSVRKILDYDQWDVIKYSSDDGTFLTGKQKLLETNRLLRLLRALITDKKRDDSQFLNLAKYGAVLRYGVRYEVDYKSAREDLGINELIREYHA